MPQQVKRFSLRTETLIDNLRRKASQQDIVAAFASSKFGDTSTQIDVGLSVEGEASNEPLEGPSAFDELQQYLHALIDNLPDRKSMPTLAQLQTTYVKLSNDHLISLIKECAQFVYVGAETSRDDESADVAATAQMLSEKWKKRMTGETAVEGKGTEELREVLIDAFSDYEAFIHVVKEDGGLTPFVKAGTATPDTGKGGD